MQNMTNTDIQRGEIISVVDNNIYSAVGRRPQQYEHISNDINIFNSRVFGMSKSELEISTCFLIVRGGCKNYFLLISLIGRRSAISDCDFFLLSSRIPSYIIDRLSSLLLNCNVIHAHDVYTNTIASSSN